MNTIGLLTVNITRKFTVFLPFKRNKSTSSTNAFSLQICYILCEKQKCFFCSRAARWAGKFATNVYSSCIRLTRRESQLKTMRISDISLQTRRGSVANFGRNMYHCNVFWEERIPDTFRSRMGFASIIFIIDKNDDAGHLVVFSNLPMRTNICTRSIALQKTVSIHYACTAESS